MFQENVSIRWRQVLWEWISYVRSSDLESMWYGVFFRPLKSSQCRVEANSLEQLNSRASQQVKEGNGSESPLTAQIRLAVDGSCLPWPSCWLPIPQSSRSPRSHGASFTGGELRGGRRRGKDKKSKAASSRAHDLRVHAQSRPASEIHQTADTPNAHPPFLIDLRFP